MRLDLAHVKKPCGKESQVWDNMEFKEMIEYKIKIRNLLICFCSFSFYCPLLVKDNFIEKVYVECLEHNPDESILQVFRKLKFNVFKGYEK